MRPFVTFDADAPDWRVRDGQAARLRADAALMFLALVPGIAFARQRSNFILGWRAAAQAGAAVASGAAAGAVGVAGAPVLGSWMMLPDLTSPATQTVLPMNDSLYGACHLELDRQGPVVLHVPADPDDRYFSVAVVDAHFNNIAHLGPQWTGRGSYDVLIVPPGFSGETPDGMHVVQSPTPSVCLLNRALVHYDDGDIDRVRAWRTGFTLRPQDGPLVEVETDDLVHPTIAAVDDPWEYFRIGLDHVERNPFPPEMAWVADAVDLGALMAAEHEDWAQQAVRDGIEDAQAVVDATLTAWPTQNGWRRPYPWIGLPNAHVVENAAIQLYQVGSNDSAEAMYFFAGEDGDGLTLDGSGGSVHELTFPASSLPPVGADGFWSLTMYGPDNLLVENPIGRYSTRPTRPGFVHGPDGSATVVLSAALPDGVDEANWLPAPDGPFQVGLRLYYPLESARRGGWFPPAVRRTG